MVEGVQRMEILGFPQLDPFIVAEARVVDEPFQPSVKTEALMRGIVTQFDKAVNLSRNIPTEALSMAINLSNPGRLADLVAVHLPCRLESKQEILETFPIEERLDTVFRLLVNEVHLLEVENEIESKVKEGIHSTQREAFLREQMRVIEEELGQETGYAEETEDFHKKIEAANMPQEAKEKAEKELVRLRRTPSISPEGVVIRNYLDWLVGLPWNSRTEDNQDIDAAQKILEEDHYGLKKIKERVLEFLAVRMLAGSDVKSPILCFVGPPGTGKTSIGKSIARALGRKFIRMSLGGVRDEAEIRGHRRTYVGALPGRIIQTIHRSGAKNPVFMIDEIDKVGMDFRGDPSAALLEVLDPEQNNSFTDHFIEVPFDLSEVLFITTANFIEPIIPALKDRMEVIEFPGYIEDEKLQIAIQFLIPKELKANGLDSKNLALSESALSRIVRQYAKEAGVRNLERSIGEVCRKVAREKAAGRGQAVHVTERNLHKFLGPPRYHYGAAEKKDEIGVATGLGWTEAGGDLLSIEVTFVNGKGDLVLTGRLGEVMRESGQTALSYARGVAKKLGNFNKSFEKQDTHIHAPAGAIPKEGPSAGITMATAILSALSEIPVRKDVAMTGEVTLRGKVLPVGGIKEKVLAAHRAGILNVILPADNEKDLEEIPSYAKKALRFHFVENMEQVLNTALIKPLAPPSP
jgi:ATP-dependent Lon protease